MPNFDFAVGTFALPVWAAGAAVVLFVVIGVLTLTRAGASLAGTLVCLLAVVICVAAVGLFLGRTESRERSAERRALDQRAADLTSRALASGSALACLDAVAGDAVETACERAVFATPESTAAAVSYVSARLVLLADSADFARRSGRNYEGALTLLRMALETDRFGIVAHVLSVRDSCTPLLCDSYALLHDAGRVQANLRERVFSRYVERYAADWAARAQKSGPPLAEGAGNALITGSTPATAPASAPATVATPVSSKYDFPSAASIPPVSIMNPEPGMPPDTKVEKTESKSANAPTPPRRPQQAASRPAPKPAPAAPHQAAPATPVAPATPAAQ
jgi:hypothetical protein